VGAVLSREHVDRVEEDHERSPRSRDTENKLSEMVGERNEIARNCIERQIVVETDVVAQIGEQWNDARTVGRCAEESDDSQRARSVIVQPLSRLRSMKSIC